MCRRRMDPHHRQAQSTSICPYANSFLDSAHAIDHDHGEKGLAQGNKELHIVPNKKQKHDNQKIFFKTGPDSDSRCDFSLSFSERDTEVVCSCVPFLLVVVRSMCFVVCELWCQGQHVSTLIHSGADPSMTFDPRFLVFEYLFNILLRRSQINLMDKFMSCVEEGSAPHASNS